MMKVKHIALCFCKKEGQRYSCVPHIVCRQKIFAWYYGKALNDYPYSQIFIGNFEFSTLNELTCTNGKGSSQDSALNLIDKDKDQMTVSLNKDRYYI